MSNIFLLSGFISILYFVVKFLEMRYIDNESKPLKLLIRDTIVVYFCILIGGFILSQFNPIIKEISNTSQAPMAFTDNPSF
jgi:hypothetical protein